MKIINGILLSSLLLMCGCNNIENISFDDYVMRSVREYQNVTSFSLQINSETEDYKSFQTYDYDYKNKIVHYVVDGTYSTDAYLALIDNDYYEFYGNEKYTKVDKESYAYKKWNLVTVSNSTYISLINTIGYQIFSILDYSKETNYYDGFTIERELKGTNLKGSFKKKNGDLTFEFKNFLLSSLSYVGVNPDDKSENINYTLNFTTECSIKVPKMKDYTLMEKNELATNEVDKDLLLTYTRYEQIPLQFEIKRTKYEKDEEGNKLDPKELIIKVDYINEIVYVKNNSVVSPIEYYVLPNENEGIDIYDVTYKKVENKKYTSFEFVYLTLASSYCDKYNSQLFVHMMYNDLHTDDNCKIYSNDFIDFDLIYNGDSSNEIYKIDNNFVTYYCKENLDENTALLKEKVYLDYNRSIIKPNLDGYQGGN